MRVVYDRLFALMKATNVMMKDIRGFVGSSTITRLQHNESVTMDVIGKLCEYLGCQPNDIVEVIYDPEFAEQRKQQQIAELQRQIEQLQGK